MTCKWRIKLWRKNINNKYKKNWIKKLWSFSFCDIENKTEFYTSLMRSVNMFVLFKGVYLISVQQTRSEPCQNFILILKFQLFPCLLNSRKNKRRRDCNKLQKRKTRILYQISKQIYSRKYKKEIWSK